MSRTFRTPYNYDRNEVSKATGVEFKKPSRTRQSDAEEADINTIVKRFGITGKMPGPSVMPQYGDYSEVFDFQTAQNQLIEAEKAFMRMPHELRKQLDHDPQKFLEFCSNPDNEQEFRKYNLYTPEKLAEKLKKDADILAAQQPKQ